MTSTRKVLVVTTTFPLREGDGQPRFILDLCQSLPQHFKLRVLAPSAPGYAADERMDDIRVHRFRYFPNRFETLAYGRGILGNLQAEPARWLLVPFFLLGMVIALRRELRLFRPDIVHAHWWLPAGFAAVIAIMTTSSNARLLITCHGSDYFVLGGRFRRLRRWVFEHADLVTMVSPAMCKHALLQDLPGDKLRVAPMGVHLKNGFEPPAVTERRGVLYVGRLAPGKGVDVLLRAWAKASDDVRAEGLRIIGEGNQREALAELAGALGVADSAVFAGTVSHEALPAHYQHAALLVFPSVAEEGLGLVVIEAMGCGCPVLISDLPALADVVIDGQTGFLFPQGDHAKLALRLDELMRQPALRTAVAERGREAILSHFDWSVVGENYRTLYDELRQQQDGDDS